MIGQITKLTKQEILRAEALVKIIITKICCYFFLYEFSFETFTQRTDLDEQMTLFFRKKLRIDESNLVKIDKITAIFA